MVKKIKFKVELEVEVGYEIPDEQVSVPYTSMGCAVDSYNILNINTDYGKIVDANIKKIERQN